MKYIVALDQGTTSSRTIIFDKEGNIVSVAQKEFPQLFPQPGWVEHNPREIWSSQASTIIEALTQSGISTSDIAALGITNQRETTIVWDAETGSPVYNAIVWQDRRTADYCNELMEQGWKDRIRQKTGLIPDAYFSATKIRWILNNVVGAREKAEAGNLRFGTVDTWLIWNLTKGQVHVTDVSNASRTMLYNIHTLQWDEELLELMDIPRSMLPEVHASSEVYGYTSTSIASTPIPIAGIAGDQQAALFGQMCTDPGAVKNTYGTGCFMLMNTGNKPILSKKGLLTTIAWTLDGKTTYALEGSVFIGGAAIQWLRDGLKVIKEAPEADESALKVKDNGGVYFVPAFVGLGTPYWDDDVRGTIFGMTRATNRHHIVRATLEAIAFQSKDVFDIMSEESQIDIKSLQVDGGATNSNVLMQFQSDILQIDIQKPCCLESTALGVCYLAGLQSGFFKSIKHVKECHDVKARFSPKMPANLALNYTKAWKNAVAAARSFKA